MTLDDLIKSINPEIYQNLKTAVELGKWPTGQKLTEEQVGLCLQAIMHYESSNDLPDADRIGHISRESMPAHKRKRAKEEEQLKRSIAVQQLH
ncbi:YeaC family protein [Litoribacillus peritrichatus]|uniref:YeaC family protein n=1 Tax=Litoribacillus peritrichatus TaxID=718191 RepID=A0ABP7M3J4_9GAMM